MIAGLKAVLIQPDRCLCSAYRLRSSEPSAILQPIQIKLNGALRFSGRIYKNCGYLYLIPIEGRTLIRCKVKSRCSCV